MSVIALKEKLVAARAERDYYASLVEAFLTGEVPSRASLQHFIFAQWGRKRLEEQRTVPALLKAGDCPKQE